MVDERLRESRSIRPSRYSKWRAATLASVYLLMVVHIIHWKASGKTLAPLELHEVMYTLELGVVTAGFLLMAAAFLSAAVFGRFFCSWGCHLLALEDLCAWAHKKIGIRPRPVRSRLLLLVPVGASLYMFLWPQFARLIVRTWPQTTAFFGARPEFKLRVLTDAEGWASFMTTDFWRNLPGPGIAIATLVICGFVVVYFLGSRSFCTYACPYGVIFGFMDRFSPGRLVLRGDCTGCGHCTAVCDSNIRVHEEVKRFGRVVSPGCLKDLDCVGVCPTGGLRFGFTSPALFTSWLRRSPPRVGYGFSIWEEVLMIGTFLASMLIFRGLYSLVPFLMTLGIGVILAFLAVFSLRLVRRESFRLNDVQLKISGRLTGWGRVAAVSAGLLGVLVLHSAFIRYHEYRSIRSYERVSDRLAGGIEPEPGLVVEALRHLEIRDRWGLLRAPDIDWRLASLHLVRGSPEIAEARLRRILEDRPEGLGARLELSRALIELARTEEARRELRTVATSAPRSEFDSERVALYRSEAHRMLGSLRAGKGDRHGAIAEFQASLAENWGRPEVHSALAELLAEDDRLGESAEHLKTAVALSPGSASARYNLGVVLAMQGREEQAIEHLREAVRLSPGDAQAHNTLGRVLARRGRRDAAEEHFRKAIQIEPGHREAHLNLARILLDRGEGEKAEVHLERARELERSLPPVREEAGRRRAGP